VFKKKWKSKFTTPDDEPREIKDVAKAREKTLNRAFNILSVKPYSVAEMRRRLLEKDWTNAEIVDSVLETLKEYNYLNDAQYAENFASYNIRQKPQGKRKLQLKLAQKRVDKETAKEALEKVFEETPEADLLNQALEKRLRLKGIPKDRDETKKLFDYLLRQGFSFDLVREKVSEIGKTEIENE
jgi:regulatory protein